jgi:hypothetical protein
LVAKRQGHEPFANPMRCEARQEHVGVEHHSQETA